MASFPPAAKAIADAILAALQDQDRTIAWLARRVDVSDSTLRRQLHERPDKLPHLTICKVAAALEAPLSALSSPEAYVEWASGKRALAVAR